MLDNGIIQMSNSLWASPVVTMHIKDGDLRFYADFQQLNTGTIKDAHPLPHTDDLSDALHSACWFSTLDLKKGY